VELVEKYGPQNWTLIAQVSVFIQSMYFTRSQWLRELGHTAQQQQQLLLLQMPQPVSLRTW
jgi:hypothetical protein